MKKLFIAVLMTAAIATSAFASDVTKVPYKVLNNFNSLFKSASQVNWIIKDDFTKAQFSINGIEVEAFYDVTGDMIGVSRKISYESLPLNAIEQIAKDYKKYQFSSAVEFDYKGEKNYYVFLADGNKKKILVVSLYGAISKFDGLNKE